MSYRTGWWLPDTFQANRLLFENEFLRREFGLLIYSGVEEKELQLERARKSELAILLTDTSLPNLKALKNFPSQSIALFILSDETYKIVFNLRALLNRRVKFIVRNYPLPAWRGLFEIAQFSLDKTRRLRAYSYLWKLLPFALFSGIYILASQVMLKSIAKIFKKQILEIPLGYESSFGRNYAANFNLDEGASLIDYALNAPNELFHKSVDISFLGQIGNLDRQMMLAEAESYGVGDPRDFRMKITKNRNYIQGRSQDAQQNYMQLILKSRFTLCPPGNYSGVTFRFYESLLSRSFPLQDYYVFSDPLFVSPFTCKWKDIVVNKKIDFFAEYDHLLQDIYKILTREKDSISCILQILISDDMNEMS